MWEAKYKVPAGFPRGWILSSTMLALLAIDETKSTDRVKLKDWLEKQDFMTPLGSSKFIKSRIALHQAFGTMVVFQRQKMADGTIGNVIIYPEQAATGKLRAAQNKLTLHEHDGVMISFRRRALSYRLPGSPNVATLRILQADGTVRSSM